MISSFQSLDSLHTLINSSAGQSLIDKTGDTVNTIQSAEGSNPLFLPEGGTITHTGSALIGALPSLEDEGIGSDSSLFCDFYPEAEDDIPFGGPGGATVVLVEQRLATGSGSWTFNFASSTSGSGTTEFGMRRFGSTYRIFCGRSSVDTSTALTTGPMVMVITHDGTADSLKVITDAGTETFTSNATSDDYKTLRLMSNLQGKLGLFVAYTRGVTDGEAADLLALANQWKDNNADFPLGTAPQITVQPATPMAASVDGSITVTASATGTPTPTRAWYGILDSDPTPNNWQPVADIFSGTVTETPSGDAVELRVDGLQDNEDCVVALLASNTAAPDGIRSNNSVWTISASYPTSERFGPVRANDTNANYTWQLQAPGDTDNWQDVPVAGYDITPDVVGDDQYLDVNSATVDQNGTLVRCFAKTDYSDGIYTEINTLNVVEA